MATHWPEGLKQTRQRRLVWEIMQQAETPVTAQQVSAALERNGTPVWLSTVYRILDAFTEHQMVTRTLVLDTGIALYEAYHHGHRHYAICLSCQRVIPMSCCPLDHVVPQLDEAGFRIDGHLLQVFGCCAECGAENA